MLASIFLAVALIVAPTSAFQPSKQKWSEIYDAYPQPISATQYVPYSFSCLSAFALCAYANCTVTSFDSYPPIAECGCVTVRPRQFPAKAPYNLGASIGLLDKKLKKATKAVCGKGFDCTRDSHYNTAPACEQMMPSLSSPAGKAKMYSGKFDIISTFNDFAWPENTTANQGQKGSPQICSNGGVFVNCFSAGCMYKKAWNGLDTTCYCPIYYVEAGTNFSLSGHTEGYSCLGQSVDGKLKYVQNGL
ncbi:hypothetical protein CEUSTIGMA_g2248.t1 [Chlamydomonas eustigma]|uniref:Pherophorin domain-containing protein n=1 Tax=Chlamydomonas eustigma TaxID=1157962 RepID=A0A250WVF7_9CHLO|nr:hypothetical protein CEUSTIGMA_g2248.t1 [Chlamydomonas eustigma]|eukprot:GAX74801.1 hypothetical protein CEUSTIGMA_g2248.t1 [Chlamydomonas eustigma]